MSQDKLDNHLFLMHLPDDGVPAGKKLKLQPEFLVFKRDLADPDSLPVVFSVSAAVPAPQQYIFGAM